MRPWAAVADWFESNAGPPLNMPAGTVFFGRTKVQTVQLQGAFLERSCGDQFVLSWTRPQEFRSDKIAHLAIAHYMSPFFNRK